MLGGLEALLGGAVVALASVIIAYFRGKSAGKRSQKDRAAHDYQRTMEGAANADVARDADDARTWLGKRPPRSR